MRLFFSQLMLSTLLAYPTLALDVPQGTVFDEEDVVVVSNYSHDNELQVAGTLHAATALIIGDNCYDTIALVSGTGVLDSGSIYLGDGSRGCRLLVKDGGMVRASSFSVYGDETAGVAYTALQNYVSVSGPGSRLEVSGQLNIWSPNAPGQPGDPFDIPREIPAFLDVEDGAEVVTDSLAIANGSWLSIRSGGKLTIESDFNAATGRVFQMEDGTLSVGGELSGLANVDAGRRVEAASVLGSLNVDGILSAYGNSDAITIQGDLVMSEQGILELSSTAGISISGETTLGGMLRVNFEHGPMPSVGDQIQLFDFQAGVSGQFESVEPLSSDGSLEWDLSELNSTGVLHVIPEPATLVLLGIGGLFFAFRRSSFNI